MNYEALVFYLPYGLLAGWFVFSLFYLIKANWYPEKVNSYLLQGVPGLFTTIGVFGTFLGIAIGLNDFQVDDIQGSITELLNGMKLAFLTSIIGIFLSFVSGLFMRSILHSKGDAIRLPTSEESRRLEVLRVEAEKQHTLLEAISKSLSENQRTIKETNADSTQKLLKEIQDTNKHLIEASEQSNKNTEAMVKSLNENHQLMRDKFTEFSELMAQANTEALREAMERLVKDFNDMFSDLITSLVNQNFKELNESVQSLNSWQQENRQQVDTLYNKLDLLLNRTDQFTQAIEEKVPLAVSQLDQTAGSLQRMSEHVAAISSSEGELQEILNALKTVMIEDERFVQLGDMVTSSVNRLSATSERLAGAENALATTTNALNDINSWHYANREAVGALVDRLSEVVGSLSQTDSTLSNISGLISQLVDSESQLAQILTELENVALGDGQFQQLMNKIKDTATLMENASKNAEEEQAIITEWLQREQSLHNAMQLFNSAIAALNSHLANLERIKMEEWQILDNSFDKRITTALDKSFENLDRLIMEYVQYIESNKTIEITVQNQN
ncbi:MotA/TolQ/ExbB proton channel family protein [Phaeodactylibacter xiamenensis]|uniref:MotA/TolQ/ExbB proton channel family protein n=1 Tax=Phaeodactylibacter xiamenensis TaxID=1524460 RepID=UPI003BACB2D4